jgi:hypothetical protein
MSASARLVAGLTAMVAALGLHAPAALAAAPANDDRAAAQTIGAAADVDGTTVGATREATDPPNCPENGGPTVWYRYAAPKDGTARLLLESSGGLDASVAVYERENSTLTRVACGDTRKGRLFTSADVSEGDVLIRVAERPGSQSGAFHLRFSGVLVQPAPPGDPFGADGEARGTLDALSRPFAQFSRTLAPGRDYRVRVLAGDPEACDVAIKLVDARGNEDRFDCQDYAVVTPGPNDGGRWTIALAAGGATATRSEYRVSITPVSADDLAPGRFVTAFGVATGRVSGSGPDAQDVFRFDVTKRSEVSLRLRSRGSMRLELRTESGKRVTSRAVSGDTGQIRTRLKPGRFYAVVSAAQDTGGSYRFSRLTRVITSTRVHWDARQKGPGGSSSVTVAVSPSESGRATVTLERFDPQFGWRFWLRRTVGVSGGRGGFSVPTATIGRYRARAVFSGTRRASPSHSRSPAVLRVLAPLRQ